VLPRGPLGPGSGVTSAPAAAGARGAAAGLGGAGGAPADDSPPAPPSDDGRGGGGEVEAEAAAEAEAECFPAHGLAAHASSAAGVLAVSRGGPGARLLWASSRAVLPPPAPLPPSPCTNWTRLVLPPY
jgi:hypothetical protein